MFKIVPDNDFYFKPVVKQSIFIIIEVKLFYIIYSFLCWFIYIYILTALKLYFLQTKFFCYWFFFEST